MSTKAKFDYISEVIRTRRTVKPERMNGEKIPDEDILELLQLADAAPTHAKTEPWRFVVFGPEKVASFAKQHAELFKQHTPEASFTQLKYDNLVRQGHNVSHIIVAWMKRVPTHKIPEMEEIAATAAAIQNILLAAAAKGIATFWSTGGMALHPALKQEFGLGEEDQIMAILYLGYTNDNMSGPARLIPLEQKLDWKK